MRARRHPRLRIFVLGVDSSPDPYAGVGVARSLRLAFPGAEIVALDHTPESSGLNWLDFDRRIVVPNRARLLCLCAGLQGNEFLIPCVDEDIRWLTARDPLNRRVLAPRSECLRQIEKPARSFARQLGVHTPLSILVPAQEGTLKRFLDRAGSRVWSKGRIAGARMVECQTLLAKEPDIAPRGENDQQGELLQAHVEGTLEVLSFVAYAGRLLDGVWMQKQGVTAKGKAWSGRVKRLSTKRRGQLRKLVSRLSWHGAAALEFIRDRTGDLWLIDANPRFPAWIHGATICGTNLPGALISAASGLKARKQKSANKAFSRVVVEIGVLREFEPQLRPHEVE